jgi:N-acetylglucosamine kinase
VRYVLGVDGGGSKTACLAADETGRLLGYGAAGPLNTNYIVRREAVAALQRAASAALQEAGLRGEHIDAMCLSAPMAPDAVTQVTGGLGIRRVRRAAEGETPRWAACFWTDQRVGVAIDAGTGSMARGWSRDGRTAGAGGWGATLGDEGSGYWISLQAMIAVLQAHDGRIPETRLTGPVLAHFGMADVVDMVFQASQGLVRTGEAGQVGIAPDSGAEGSSAEEAATGGMLFHRRTRREPLTRYEVASLCPVVAQVARQGDWKALEILQQAGRELGRLGVAVIQRLGMQAEEFAVLPFGGVFRAGELVLRSCRETILAAAPLARLVLPRFEPVVGAALLALDEVGVAIGGPILRTVEESSADFPGCRANNLLDHE